MERRVLVELLQEGLSLDVIGARVGRSPSTISYWLKRHGLRANGVEKYGPKVGPELPELTVLVQAGLSVPAIAERLGCSSAIVRRSLKRHGLKSRQTRNRARARTALSDGLRTVELECTRHGSGTHVLEGGRRYRCSRCRAEQVAGYRRRVKHRLVLEAGGACQLCSYDRCDAALQFHHLDPGAKEFHLSVRGITRSLENLRREAKKCVLLCATCHAEVEAGFATIRQYN